MDAVFSEAAQEYEGNRVCPKGIRPHGGHVWEVLRVFSVACGSGDSILTECDIKCIDCKVVKYIVTRADLPVEYRMPLADEVEA